MNAQNRQRNTRNHHAGSRPFGVFMDEAAKEHPEVNPYVYTYEKAYPDSQEDIVSHFTFLNFSIYVKILINNFFPIHIGEGEGG